VQATEHVTRLLVIGRATGPSDLDGSATALGLVV